MSDGKRQWIVTAQLETSEIETAKELEEEVRLDLDKTEETAYSVKVLQVSVFEQVET